MNNAAKSKIRCVEKTETDFYGASLITSSGEEVPITEQMLQQAFDTLISTWERAQKRSTK